MLGLSLLFVFGLLAPVVPALVTFRSDQKSDELAIAVALGMELMNPLGIKGERFVVAEATASDDASGNTNKRRVGWGQIRPLGKDNLWELASVYVAPEFRGEGIGSQIVHHLLNC